MLTELSHREIQVWRVVSPEGYYFGPEHLANGVCEKKYIAQEGVFESSTDITLAMTFPTKQKAEDVIRGMDLAKEGFTAVPGVIAFASGPVGISACILNLLKSIRGIAARLVTSHNYEEQCDSYDKFDAGWVSTETDDPFVQTQYHAVEQRFHILEPYEVRTVDEREWAQSGSPF